MSQGRVIALGDSDQDDAFEVSVLNSDPLLRRTDEKNKSRSWIDDLRINLAAAAVLVSLFGLFLYAADLPEMIFFAAPIIPVFLLFATLDSLDLEKTRLYTGAVFAIALIAVFVIFRGYIIGGLALLTDGLYNNAEAAQAYIYDRFNAGAMGDEHPYRSMHIAILWTSAFAALLAAVPPSEYRRLVTGAIGCFAMIAFAYYGLIPSILYIAIMAVALVLTFTRGHILSTLPVIILVMAIFGALILADPGENYSISRADENFRDRFALRSVYLERGDEMLEDLEQLNQNMQDSADEEMTEQSEFMMQNKGMVALVAALAVIALLVLFAVMMYMRVRKKQLLHREGINSDDPGTAVRSMFPYAVRWLQPAGIDTAGKTFSSLLPLISSDISEEYADTYMSMYDLWIEAAYSDHLITEEHRQMMNGFLTDTINMVKSKGNFASNIFNSVKYEL